MTIQGVFDFTLNIVRSPNNTFEYPYIKSRVSKSVYFNRVLGNTIVTCTYIKHVRLFRGRKRNRIVDPNHDTLSKSR